MLLELYLSLLVIIELVHSFDSSLVELLMELEQTLDFFLHLGLFGLFYNLVRRQIFFYLLLLRFEALYLFL